MELTIDKKLKTICPELSLGCILADVIIENSNNKLLDELEKINTHICTNHTIENYINIPEIYYTQETYRKLGRNPKRYRVSSEALLRRTLQGKGLYCINNIVEINNYLSLTTFCPVGSYDLDNISFPTEFTIGTSDQEYKGIGKDIINMENTPVFRDSTGLFGSTTSDSERAMIKETTNKILMVIINFSGKLDMEYHLNTASNLLNEFASAKNIETKIIK